MQKVQAVSTKVDLLFTSDNRAHPVCSTFSTDLNRLRDHGFESRFIQKLLRAFAKPEALKGPPFQFCSALRFFLQRAPFIFFDILQQSGFSNKHKGSPFLYFLAL